MTIKKIVFLGQAGLRNFYVVAGGLLAELWKKDSWFGFALMVPAKKSPRRAFVVVECDRPEMRALSSESERKVSFEFNFKNKRGEKIRSTR
jgi:hypothetical protein